MSDGTLEPTPLAANPATGTDVGVAPDVGDAAVRPRGPFWTHLDAPFTAGLLLTLGGLAALLLGIAISNIATVIIYIALAAFAALGLDPVLKWLERHNVKRVWGIVIVFFGFTVVGIGILALVVPTLIQQITAFITGLPSTIANFESSDFYGWLENYFGEGLTLLVTEVQKFLTSPATIAAVSGGLLKVGVGVATAISGGLIVIVLTLYFVASLPAIKESLIRFAPARNRPKVGRMTDEITDSIGSYLMGMVILAFFNSIVAFFLHLFIGLPYPLLMGVLAFAITIIPLVGPVLYWIFASVLALFTSPVAALIFSLAYLIYIQIEAYVITPKVMSKAIAIPGSLVVIGALIGGTLLGLLGALIAVPVTASILLIIKQVFIPKQDAKL